MIWLMIWFIIHHQSMLVFIFAYTYIGGKVAINEKSDSVVTGVVWKYTPSEVSCIPFEEAS